MVLMLLACFIRDEDVRLSFDPDGDGFGGREDCAPMDPTVFPGAEEICGDGVLNGCVTPEEARAQCRLKGHRSLAEADLKIVGENPGDYAAVSIAGGGDVDGDGRADLLVGAFGHDGGGSMAGAAYLLLSSGVLSTYGPTDLPPVIHRRPPGVLSTHGPRLGLGMAELRYDGEAKMSYAGYSVAFLGDVDGDGLADRAVGADNHDTIGAIYLHLTSDVRHTLAATNTLAGPRWTGEVVFDQFGFSVAAAEDLGDDALADLIVGAYGNDSGGSSAGAVYLLLSDGALTYRDTTDDRVVADCKLIGEATGDEAGISVASAGDVDGDGLSDVLVGARGLNDAGGAYLLRSDKALNPRCGTMSLADADLKLYGEAAGDVAGEWVSGVGDVDGDGHSDLIIGAQKHDGGSSSNTNVGAAYLFLTEGSLRWLNGAVSLGSADIKILGENYGDFAGFAVSSAGDVDGDGRSDLLVGAPESDAALGDGTGAAYLLYASGAIDGAGSTLNLRDADVKLIGEAAYDYASSAIASAGDVNGDGLADILIGAKQHDVDGDDTGAAYLLYGRSF